MADMIKTGVWLNLISIVILILVIYFLLPVIWGIDIAPFPETVGF